jgi:hypothetical protein
LRASKNFNPGHVGKIADLARRAAAKHAIDEDAH